MLESNPNAWRGSAGDRATLAAWTTYFSQYSKDEVLATFIQTGISASHLKLGIVLFPAAHHL